MHVTDVVLAIYSESAIQLIKQLISKKQWIEEESNDLVKMIDELKV